MNLAKANLNGMLVVFMLSACAMSPAIGQDTPEAVHNEGVGAVVPGAPTQLEPESSPTPPAAVLQRGSFSSVQVNVDANGRNILNDAANEPSIAVDPTNPNRIVIGWRQFGNVNSDFRQSGVAYSDNAGASWNNNGPLSPGKFGSDPVLAADSDGTFYYIGIDTNEVRQFKSFNGGVTWNPSSQIIAAFRDKQWFTIDTTNGPGNGHLYMTWTNSRNFIRSINKGTSWQSPVTAPISTTVWGTLSVGPDGDLYIVDRFFDVAASSNAQNGGQNVSWDRNSSANLGGSIVFQEPPNPVGLLGQPSLVTDHSNGLSRGNVYLLCSVDPPGSDPADVRMARSTDGGRSWSSSVRVNDDPTNNGAFQWFGTLSVAESGRLDAIWYDTRDTGSQLISEVWYAYSTDEGKTWSDNMAASNAFNTTIGWPQQSKIGDYIGMFSDASGFGAAYSATFTGGQDVYFLRGDVDCNNNGTHDGDDIKSGSSKDVNGNGIPDECENVCAQINKLKVKCRKNKLRATVKSDLPGGTVLTLSNNGDEQQITLNAKGKGKAKWLGQAGVRTVEIVECPEFNDTVDCG